MRIADNALVAAAVLSSRYIADRFLPDKAIDLVDESAARLKMEITSKPEEIDEIDRKILQLEMENCSAVNPMPPVRSDWNGWNASWLNWLNSRYPQCAVAREGCHR